MFKAQVNSLGHFASAGLARWMKPRHRNAVTFKDYLLGKRVTLVTRLTQHEVENALRQNVGKWFNPFYTGVVGWCRFDRVGLRWATAMWSNGFQPTFQGKLASIPGATQLAGRFGAPPLLLIFFALWYSLLTLILVSIISAYLESTNSNSNLLINLAGATLFLFVPVGFHLLFNRGADRQFENILAFLGECADLEIGDKFPRI